MSSWVDTFNAYNPFNIPGVLATVVQDNRSWLTKRTVRTVGDFWSMAAWALSAAQKEKPSLAAIYAAPARDVKTSFPASQTMPALFQRLVAFLSTAPQTKRAVQLIAKEYWQNVENKATTAAVPASTPTFSPSTTAYQPATPAEAATPTQPATFTDKLTSIPWWVPVVGAGVIIGGIAVGTRGRRR